MGLRPAQRALGEVFVPVLDVGVVEVPTIGVKPRPEGEGAVVGADAEERVVVEGRLDTEPPAGVSALEGIAVDGELLPFQRPDEGIR